MPHAPESRRLPASETDSAHPGLRSESHWAKISSTSAVASEAGSTHAAAMPAPHSSDARMGRRGRALIVELLGLKRTIRVG